jgi:hypothetical protein
MAARTIVPVRALLVCGMLSSLVYVVADVLAALRYADYHSFASQAVSELSAIGAPSRPLVLPLLVAHSVLALAFGAGVWRAAGPSRALRSTGRVLMALGIVDLLAPFFTVHVRGAEATLTDAVHIALTVVTVLLILLAIGCAAPAFGKRFRVYSVVTIATLAVCGVVAGLLGRGIAAHEPTPWIGVPERINIGGYLLWQFVLAVVLLRARDPALAGSARQPLAGSGDGRQPHGISHGRHRAGGGPARSARSA